MDQILDRLWCGNYEDAQRVLEVPPASPVTYILNVSQYPYQAATHSDLPTVHYPIQDEVFLPAATWENLTQLLADILAARYTVLVHCRLGKSRGPSLCAAYLMRCGYSAEKALKMVKLVRDEADPHKETWASVLSWFKNEKDAMQ